MEAEWVQVAGGAEGERYPWDVQAVTTDEAEALRRANINAANLNGTSPVGMYVLGKSALYDVLDMAGNVWEWTASYYDEESGTFALRGGSWHVNLRFARVAVRDWNYPGHSSYGVGFRVVAPVVLPSTGS